MSVSIDGYLIDMFETEQPVKQARVTRYPVEKGASIADHVIHEPQKLTVTGIVSNNPFGATFDARSSDDKPSVEAYALLSKIYAEHKLVTVITSTRTLDSMLLVAISDPRNAGTGDALHFTANFEQIETIDISTESKTTIVKLPRHKKKKKKGASPSKLNDINSFAGSKAESTANNAKGKTLTKRAAEFAGLL